MSDRSIAVGQVYASMHGRPDLPSFKDYLEATSTWEVIPIAEAGHIIGAIFRHGFWLHVGVVRPPAGSMRRLIRNVLMTTIAAHGRVMTTVREEHFEGIAFCERLGFREAGNESGIVYMICERARYA